MTRSSGFIHLHRENFLNNMQIPKTTIIFIKVTDTQSKLVRICETVQHHFNEKQSILINAASEEAAIYIDQLLWRFPEESFLPHLYTSSPTKEPIVVTTSLQNLNQAKILFNLGSSISPISTEFEKIYELYDCTHPQKEQMSKEKLAVYQQIPSCEVKKC